MPKPLSDASRLLPGKHHAPWQEEQLPGFPASLHSRKPEAGSNLPGAPARKLSSTFTANTCPKCGAITIAGISEDTGCRLDLEPSPLTDLDEYRAIVDQVRTYNLGDDLAAMRRFVTEVRAPTRVDRHALHTCGKTYGHGSSTRTRTRTPVQPDEPPF